MLLCKILKSLAKRRLKLFEIEISQQGHQQFMGNFTSKGLVGFASETEVKVWCMSHHAVYHLINKPVKIRVLLDDSAELNSKLTNKELKRGSDLTNHLIGGLIQFEQDLVAFTGDIESMFYKVLVAI